MSLWSDLDEGGRRQLLAAVVADISRYGAVYGADRIKFTNPDSPYFVDEVGQAYSLSTYSIENQPLRIGVGTERRFVFYQTYGPPQTAAPQIDYPIPPVKPEPGVDLPVPPEKPPAPAAPIGATSSAGSSLGPIALPELTGGAGLWWLLAGGAVVLALLLTR